MSPLLTGVVVFVLTAVAVAARLVETVFVRLGRARAQSIDESLGSDRLGVLVADRYRIVGPASLIRLAAIIASVTILVLAVRDTNGVGVVAAAVAAYAVPAYLLVEVLPARWALENNDHLARVLARPAAAVASFGPLRWLTGLLGAIIGPLSPSIGRPTEQVISEDELLAMAEAAAEADVIESDEAGLIESIIELGDTIAREVMVPRPDMITVPREAKVRDAIRLVLDHGFTRLPVIGEDVDDVVGVVISKDLMRAHLAGLLDEPLEEAGVIRDLPFVPESKKVAELMREMQGAHMHMAIVVDEYGGTAGLITLEDIIEELVGEIVDEYDDEQPLIEELADGDIRVSGRLGVDEFRELLDVELPDGEWDTVGGLLLDLVGHVPRAGESAQCDGVSLTAERVEGRRIETLRVSR
ncbi:MAG TPA: HlyC/CorC family transporter [Acidimicrobiales bacterium]|nr:HlyC/CorC family transporter [Acidimicrobiales bacterium]